MRCSQILVAFCVLSNLYQSRDILLRFMERSLQSIVLFSMDAQRYIQERMNSSREDTVCNQMERRYNLSQYADQCPQHRYTIRVIERRPLMLYIEQFLTQDEIEHLIELA